MKKTFLTTALLFGLAAASQAAIIEWGLSSFAILDSVRQAGATAHLMFLDPDDSANLVTLDTRYTRSAAPASLYGQLAAGASAEQTIIYGDSISGTDYFATTGQGGFFVRVFSMDNQYFIDSATFAFTGNETQLMNTTVAMNFGTILETAADPETSHSSTGWTPVPEPATGMLALAGVALLLRRRRRA